ncbi:MAG: helix-turn-helix domain-containing protein [Bacteroidia bacterium]
MHLGLKIKVERIKQKLTQEELAEKINKTRPLVSSIEQTGKAGFYTLQKICTVLGLDMDELTDPAYDPLHSYSNKEANDKIKALEQEIEYLKKLADSQAELIKALRENKSYLQKRKSK